MPPRSARWQGRVRTSPSGVLSTGRPASSAGSIAKRAAGRPLGQRAIDHPRSFLRLERAAGVDQHTTRREHVDGGPEQLALQPGEAEQRRPESCARRCPGGGGSSRSRCRARRGGHARPVVAGAIRGRRRPRPRRRAAGGRDWRAGARPGGRRLDRHRPGAPAAASCAVLPPGAAQRSMHHAASRSPAADARAGPRRHPAPTRRPRRSPAGPRSARRPLGGGCCRQMQRASSRSAQCSAVSLDREVERRLGRWTLAMARARSSP